VEFYYDVATNGTLFTVHPGQVMGRRRAEREERTLSLSRVTTLGLGVSYLGEYSDSLLSFDNDNAHKNLQLQNSSTTF
jgi:hypothetical protein